MLKYWMIKAKSESVSWKEKFYKIFALLLYLDSEADHKELKKSWLL